MHLVGTSSREVSIRDDQSALATSANPKAKQETKENVMTSWGEFGSILAMIFGDAANGKVNWSHWEQNAGSAVAVFNYSVPKTASHYVVVGSLPQHAPVEGGPGAMPGGFGLKQGLDVSRTTPYRITPGYYGSLWLDPATGTVLRVTIETDLKDRDQVKRADALVQYGPVTIGDHIFICPVRSLTLHMDPIDPADTSGAAPLLKLNETQFIDYHRFASTARILTGAPPESVSSAPGNSGPPESSSPVADAHAPESAPTIAPATEPRAEAPAHVPATPSEREIPEVALTVMRSFPDHLVGMSGPQQSDSRFNDRQRRVDVAVVVNDKRGHPAEHLNPEDFEIDDEGQKQNIGFFARSEESTGTALALASVHDQAFSNRFVSRAVGTSATPLAEAAATILLVDETQVVWKNPIYVRKQMIDFVKSMAPTEMAGFYILTQRGFRVLQEVTADHEALRLQLEKWTPETPPIPVSPNNFSQKAASGNPRDPKESNAPIDHRFGGPDNDPVSDPASYTAVVQGMARHLSFLAGFKNLVWITSGDAFDRELRQTVKEDKSVQASSDLALTVEEALNDAHAVVFPLDVSQLQVAGSVTDAEPSSADLAQMAQSSASGAADKGLGPQNSSGRGGLLTSRNELDIPPAGAPAHQPVDQAGMRAMRQIAEATAGRMIPVTKNLSTSLTSLLEEGNATYEIGFYPLVPPDNKYHNLEVKLNVKGGWKLRYRKGYFYAKDPTTLKKWFQQAIWQPANLSEIGLTASPVVAPGGTTLKLNIAADDLTLQQEGERRTGKLDIFLVEQSTEGRNGRMRIYALDLNLKPATYDKIKQDGLSFERLVEEEPNPSFLRVFVLDENSGRIGSITIPAAALMTEP